MRRIAHKLAFAFGAVLLANCSLPADNDLARNEDGLEDGQARMKAVRGTDPQQRFQRGDVEVEAKTYAMAAARRAGVRDPEFQAFGVKKDVDGLSHVRLRQMHQGFPVWGGDVVVHLSDAVIRGVAGNLATGLRSLPRANVLAANDALARAKAESFTTRNVVAVREQAEPVVFVKDGVAHLAFHTSFFNEQQGDLEPAHWNHILDARTGDVLVKWNALHTVEQASGPGGNPKTQKTWTSELDVEGRAASYVMTTDRLKTLDMKQGSWNGVEVTGALTNIGDAPINDAHGYAEVTLNLLTDWFGRNSIDDHGFRITSRVHYGNQYENAFWDGSQMTYGDGRNKFYPLSGALDVVAHEIHHGFTSFHSDLAYYDESGGLNEGFSDIAGKTAEFFYKTNPNWDLGGDVFKEQNRALRYMCNPTADGHSIDHASQMDSWTDPHYSSGVPNKAFCRVSKRLSGGDPEGNATKEGVKRAATAFYLANAEYWTSSSTFVQGCQGTVDAARALEFSEREVAALVASWADVGVTCR